MTLLSRRKRPTTARRITPATRAVKLAAFAVLLGSAGVLAQPPGYQPLNYRQQAAQQGGQNGQPANGLPLPPGYRPRTPPPQAQAQPQQPLPGSGAMPGSSGGGTVMYFQKPADALAATGGSGSAAPAAGEVAQLNDPKRVPPIPVPVADAPASTLPPPPPPSRYLPAPGGASERPLTPPLPRPEIPAPRPEIPPAPVAATPPGGAAEFPVSSKQPSIDPIPPSTSLKKENKIVPVDPKLIQLPPRESIFTVYNDADLERAVIGRMIQDRITEQQSRLKAAQDELKTKTDPKEIAEQKQTIAEIEKTLRELQSIKDPLSEPSYRFPALPVISPPGVAYKPKTSTYEPRKVIVEPGFVMHRRLHFEEKNAERTGWDFGPAQTLVSAAYFWKDTLLLPQSLASGCVYGFWDTSAGKCLPGSPSPYFLYPPGLTCTGTVVEGVVITGGFFLFP